MHSRSAAGTQYVFKLKEYTYTYLSRLDLCIADLTQLIDKLSSYAPGYEVVLCLGHHNNFRYSVFPQYKSNRRGIQKAAFAATCASTWSAPTATCVLPNTEADDALGVMYRTVICSTASTRTCAPSPDHTCNLMAK